MRWSSNLLRTHAISSILLIFLISTDLSILLNIPVFRQILGSIFLAFVPGALFLCILKPDKIGLTEKFVLSVGLSISFIMFIGILINTLYPLFGYETPLSLKSLVISFTFAILILAIIAYLSGGFTFFAKKTDLRFDIRDKALVVIPVLFLPLSVLGIHIMNTTDNNAMLMALLFLIPVYVISISIWHSHISEKIYPIIIFLSSTSLVLLMGMRSNHIIGADVHREYYIFQQTLLYEKWQILEASTLDSCLSISVLPAVYQSFLNINPEYLFKILYPLMFSISPLIIYLISKKYISNTYAFLSSVFFFSQTAFLNTALNPRTTVAILFVALSIMVLLNHSLPESKKRLLLIIFSVSCVVSHYSTTYIFFIILIFSFICTQAMHRVITYQRRSATIKPSPSDKQNMTDSNSYTSSLRPSEPYFTLGFLTILFVTIFLWYSQVTGAAFNSGVGFFLKSITSLQDFFIVESREQSTVLALGFGVEKIGLSRKVGFVFNWLAIIFIAVGVLTTLGWYRQMVVLPYENAYGLSGFLKKRIDIMFLSFGLACSAIMFASIALPLVSNNYGLDRAYLLVTVVLSSFFILGGMNVSKLINVRSRYLVVLLVLVPLFLFNTGVVHQLFGYPGSITLNSAEDGFDTTYIRDQETISAKWLKDYAGEDIKIYADYWGGPRLISQSGIRVSFSLFPIIEEKKSLGVAYIYLTHSNVIHGKLFFDSNKWRNITDYTDKLAKRELIYANGNSNILFCGFEFFDFT